MKKRPLGIPGRTGKNNIKMSLNKEVGWGDVDWNSMVQDRDRRWSLVNAVMNSRFP